MSIGINTNYSTSLYGAGNKTKSMKDYSNYLTNKYPCLTPGKAISVTISPTVMRKAMNSEKTAKWLEENLAMMPDTIKKQQDICAARGDRIISESTEITDDEVMTSTLYTVTDSEPNTEVDKWLEKIKEKKEENLKEQKKQDDKIKEITVQGSDAKA